MRGIKYAARIAGPLEPCQDQLVPGHVTTSPSWQSGPSRIRPDLAGRATASTPTEHMLGQARPGQAITHRPGQARPRRAYLGQAGPDLARPYRPRSRRGLQRQAKLRCFVVGRANACRAMSGEGWPGQVGPSQASLSRANACQAGLGVPIAGRRYNRTEQPVDGRQQAVTAAVLHGTLSNPPGHAVP
jgi:hypothetical protein